MQQRAQSGRFDMKSDGIASLKVNKTVLRRLNRALSEARRLSDMDVECGDELRRLAADTRLIEAAIPAERVRSLPTCDGWVRLSIIIGELLRGGEVALTEESLMDALRGCPLTLRELWSAPTALRVSIVEALSQVCAAIVQDAREGVAAERWVNRPGRLWRKPSPVFIERVLRLCGEEDLPDARARLEKCLRKYGVSASLAIRQAHDVRAHLQLRLDNLMDALRLLDRLDWQTCFETLSEVDAELRRDPAGVYPLMDGDSRHLVLEQVAVIACAAGLSERAVARHANAAAREHACQAGNSLEDIVPASTCCWWLWDDVGRAALLKRMGRPRAHLPKRIPDPHGVTCISSTLLLTAATSLLLWRWLRMSWLLPACIPAAWAASDAVIGRVFPLFCKPLRLLKLKLDRLPDTCRTLIVTPVLLTDVGRVDAACDALEALGCLEDDPNLACLLLGDFVDADREEMPGDDAIVRHARERIAEMNRRAGREKYYYLHRPRTLLKADRRYMGRDRKRGALMDLNRLLLGGPSAFTVEGAASDVLRVRYSYVVTLDADTRMLPGTVHRLVGALAHPLNRHYAVLQPRMEIAPSSVVNRFALMYAGAGGLDTYPTCVSSLWMDATGAGIYGGKGIYRVSDFQKAVYGALPEGRILSHDLIEGALAGAGFIGDVALYDGCPTTLSGWTLRQHRWTRGDWQLLPFIFSPKTRVHFADRFRMIDNLMRSLRTPALWLLLMYSAWTGRAEGLAAGMLLTFLKAILHPLDADNWRRGLLELVTLPHAAYHAADAALRALWRVFVSGRHLMDWVPSAETERGGAVSPLPGRIAALLTLPGLLIPDGLPAVAALFMLFWVGTDWVRDLEAQPVDDAEPLTADQRAMLRDLARDTWRFFAECVTPDGPLLPPDNVQLDPPAGAARRTSPTNIALYLLSCISARRLGFIDHDECIARVCHTLDALDRVEKWRGHLYNWIDIDTLAPLHPHYVSAVDSGNLAACALACANMIGDDALSARLKKLAEGMDFAALYDEDRHLFFIGVDVDADRPSASHYDLLASESRILSYTALMLGQVPLKHWSHLGRRCVPAGRGAALASWSGTMFEYLMPELLMRAPALSLMGESVRNAVRAQMAQGSPWGVSESGYHAFDARMNYQYRAFGLKSLALSGNVSGDVVAPYASALALAVQPNRAAENIAHMNRLGWRDAQGFYEAADALCPGPDGAPSLVKSHMAHHQGMVLCAVCNALTDDSLVRGFMDDPRARALSLLLEERPACASKLKPIPRQAQSKATATHTQRTARHALDVHLLSGNRAHALVTPDGAVHYSRNGFDATRFYGDLVDRPDGARLHLSIDGMAAEVPLLCRYDAGSARFEGAAGGLHVDMTVSLSPEDDALYRFVELKNTGARPVRVEVMDAVPVSLARPRDFLAHPAFQLLFIESEIYGDNGLLFRRRPRDPDESSPVLIHTAFTQGNVERDSRYENVFDREGGARFDLTGAVGTTINPASALKVTLEIAPGETEKLYFALRLCEPGEPFKVQNLPERAAALNRARSEAMLGFLGISSGLYHRLDRLSALLLDPALSAKAKANHSPAPGTPRSALWPMGISSDRPILSMIVTNPEHASMVREIVKAQCFYRDMGLNTDLVLIDAHPDGYDMPVSAMLHHVIDTSPLRLREHVFILSELTPEQIGVIRRASAIYVSSEQDFNSQVKPLLSALDNPTIMPSLDPGRSLLPPAKLFMDNGFGGFAPDGGYEIDVRPGHSTPAPWSNIHATDGMGILLTERGGGFVWHGNSRFCRLTGYRGDPLRERFGLSLTFVSEAGETLPLLPGSRLTTPFRVKYAPDESTYCFVNERISGKTAFRISESAVLIEIELALRKLRGTLRAEVDWLMGADRGDAVLLKTWHSDGAQFATGAAEGVGWLACDRMDADGDGSLSILVSTGENRVCIALGWAADIAAARACARNVQEGKMLEPHREANGALTVDTPDTTLNLMMNAFLPHQVRASRVCGRTGYYQPGGAYGFRDQLQDMLALIPLEPDRVRSHLLLCAGRQFAAGDALHWWHMPFLGVRTHIRDDRLFLPYVTAAYVRQTGDAAALDEIIPYLEDVSIPEGQTDVFRAMNPGDASGTLHDHCMRAFRATEAVDEHGLALMGGGDWNDGMNRVGILGRGESVWLSEFIAACADSYAEICPVESDAEWLRALARRHRGAMELYGWDGQWYLRAYADDGTALGGTDSTACRIDAISQAWAVLADLSPDRCWTAMASAWELLADEDNGLIRLLTPPFDLDGMDPGYIRGYPPGVRENGAQYTHAACWLMLAWARMGDAERAHRALQMLLPPNHADTPEKAKHYRVEPYVMAGDVYDLSGEAGCGGWTWYTGSAAWLYVAVLQLLGYERRGNRVRLNALLGPWPRVSIAIRHGKSRYRLVCGSEIEQVILDGEPVADDFIQMVDDGLEHEAHFPPRHGVIPPSV